METEAILAKRLMALADAHHSTERMVDDGAWDDILSAIEHIEGMTRFLTNVAPFTGCPPRLREGVRRYVDHGLRPGGFLSAVIANDLRDALARIDGQSKPWIQSIVAHVFNVVPPHMRGSRAAIEARVDLGASSR